MKTILLEHQTNARPQNHDFSPLLDNGTSQCQLTLWVPYENALKVDRNFIKCWKFTYKASIVYLISILALKNLLDAKTILEFRGSHTL